MILFSQTTLIINKVEIAPGAYSLWLVPDKKNWTLVVNKNVKADSAYDPAQDLVREPMEIGQLPQVSNRRISDLPTWRPSSATCACTTGESEPGEICWRSRATLFAWRLTNSY